MIKYEGMNDWCREEGFMTGKFDGKNDMQQRVLENGKRKKVSRWCRLRATSLEISMMGGWVDGCMIPARCFFFSFYFFFLFRFLSF